MKKNRLAKLLSKFEAENDERDFIQQLDKSPFEGAVQEYEKKSPLFFKKAQVKEDLQKAKTALSEMQEAKMAFQMMKELKSKLEELYVLIQKNNQE